MSIEEFGRTSPRLFDYYCEELAAHRRTSLMGSGVVAAAVANFAPFEKGRTYEPWDFIPLLRPRVEQSMEEQIAILSMVMGCGPGNPGKGRTIN